MLAEGLGIHPSTMSPRFWLTALLAAPTVLLGCDEGSGKNNCTTCEPAPGSNEPIADWTEPTIPPGSVSGGGEGGAGGAGGATSGGPVANPVGSFGQLKVE